MSAMNDKPQFAARYSRLADDELARIALSDFLLPEAHEALRNELLKRGLTDLSEYKKALEEAKAASSIENQLEYQIQMRQVITEWMLVFVAWVFAVAAPFIWLETPSGSEALKVSAVGASFIAFSCYRGLKARRKGSRKGFWLKCALPLILLGISSGIVLVDTLFL